MIKTISGMALMLATAGGAFAADSAKAVFIDTKGKEIGSATLTQTPHGVLISADVSSLPPGEHGFHIHKTGSCDAGDGFKSAGDHFDPKKHEHGFKVKGGPHAGDMPNQFVSGDGKLRIHVLNPYVSLDKGEATLFDSDGSALVVHAKADDYQSQPSGEAGDRIACAVIKGG